jgi:NarL family two-component system response regulator LiaR
MNCSIRILVVDDHSIVRRGICALLATEPDLQVVGEAENGQDAMAQAARLRPDVVLMDLVMPGIDGLEAIRHIAARQPKVRMLVLTSFAGDDKVFAAIQAGALGYLLKDSGPEQLVQAIRQVHSGQAALHPIIARRLIQELAYPLEPASGLEQLTEREVQVLRLIGAGQTNREMAAHLGVGEATVRTHVSHILAKLQLDSRTQAALYALREGLASLHPTAGTTPDARAAQHPQDGSAYPWASGGIKPLRL